MIVFIVLTSNRNPTISAHTTARAVKNLHRQHGFELMCVWTTLFMSATVGALSVVVVVVFCNCNFCRRRRRGFLSNAQCLNC